MKHIDVTPDTLGECIAEARRQARLTQRTVAHRAGTTQSAISAYETHVRPGLDTLARIMDAMGFRLVVRFEPKGSQRR